MPICRYGGAACCAGPIETVRKHEEDVHGKSRYVYPVTKQEPMLISLRSAECVARYRQKQHELQ